ncbi:TetR family transcriptional regulator C-terminal domain-containing protein [Streptomyces spirodelae]|uniref:TetR family transcriptional regulator C-terminal domain-containing protein n=1 Tax=Streptomyces spirodelae TaxID=2812904 RepID=UPI0027DD6933|nr:hypothetical protein [Streptomyces spirodelae]
MGYTDPAKPRGCMIVLAATNCTPENEGVRTLLAEDRRATERRFRERVERGIAEGDVPAGTDSGTLAACHATVLFDLSVQAKDGVPRGELLAVVDASVAAWDTLTAPGPERFHRAGQRG